VLHCVTSCFLYHRLRSLDLQSFSTSFHNIFQMLDLGPRHHRMAKRQGPPGGATSQATLPSNPTGPSTTQSKPTGSPTSTQTATSTSNNCVLGDILCQSPTSSTSASSTKSASSTSSHAQTTSAVSTVRVKRVRFFFHR